MDSIKIFARPHDLDKLLQRVISFGVSVRQSILVRRQVAGNDVGTSVAIRPDRRTNCSEIRSSAKINSRIELLGSLTQEIRIVSGGVLEIRRPARGVAPVAVSLSVHNVATQPN